MDSIKFDYSKICNFVTKEEMIAESNLQADS